jgi:protein-S-isoprenylcysteine O-methyltransferase Ste14
VFLLATVLNLAVRGLGAPFAIALSRRLATDWLYARTRNPMVLACLVFLVALSLRLRSFSLLAWTVLGAAPAWTAMLKIDEERELEIRFGQPYLDYKRRTPFLCPGLRSGRQQPQ